MQLNGCVDGDLSVQWRRISRSSPRRWRPQLLQQGRVSTSSIAASLLSLSIMAPPPVVHYSILQRGGSGAARQQPMGRQDAPCQRHAPAPRQIEASSTMTYKHNQTCYIYIFNWCVCSEGRVKGPLAVSRPVRCKRAGRCSLKMTIEDNGNECRMYAACVAHTGNGGENTMTNERVLVHR